MPKQKYEEQIMAAVGRRSYQTLKPKALARKLGVSAPQYADYRKALKELLQQGCVELAKNHTIRPVAPHGTVTGTFRRTSTGTGYVRPHKIEGQPGVEIRIPENETLDAATGDTVLVRLTRKPNRPDVNPTGAIVRALARPRPYFVRTFHDRDGH